MAAAVVPGAPPADAAAQRRRHGGQQYEREDHGEVLDDEPPDRDASFGRACRAALLQRAKQHDRAGDREREAEDEARPPRPPPRPPRDCSEQRGHRYLDDRAGQRDAADREQVAQREVNAHAEHQQDHSDLGQLGRELRVRHEARREGAECDACEQIAHEGRQAEADCGEAEHQGHAESRSDRRDERGFVWHPASLVGG